jgi:hypothetical protein
MKKKKILRVGCPNDPSETEDSLGSWIQDLVWPSDSQTKHNQRWHLQMVAMVPCFRPSQKNQNVFGLEPRLLLAFWVFLVLLGEHYQWVSAPL